jgi:lipopolysaccharide export system permease protein
MSTIDKYILRTFLRNLALVLLTLIALYSLIELIEKVDDFIENEAKFAYYLLYPLFNLPVIISNTLPMSVLLATFVTIGGFSRTSQLTAMFSSGISFKSISRPLFLCSLILAALVMLGNLWLVPWSSREANYILRTKVRGKSSPEVSSMDLYFRDDNRIISINQAFPARDFVLGLTIIEFDDKFMPVKRIQAEKALYKQDGRWRLKNVVIWDFASSTRTVTDFNQQAELHIDLKRSASEMLQLSDRPEDLTINELFNTSVKLQHEGYDPKTYQMEAQVRFANTAVPVIMILVGIPFALQRGRNASFSRGILISLVIFACYFILQAIFSVFGIINVLPPLVAAWAANFLMALIGTWCFLRVES